MRRFLLLTTMLAACFHGSAPRSIHGPALGRVVVYRNGVAFYERQATASDGKIKVRVPRERVDDFLKSLTVVDRTTGAPIPVSIPRRETDDGNGEHDYLTMTIETPGHRNDQVMLTYITDAPAWRPSYRVVVGQNGKVMLEGWAIVDNLSGEDWKDVQVGVGASSALSFRYDLWSVHHVDRDLLQGDETFAVAPPTGVSPYAEHPAPPEELLSEGGTTAVAQAEATATGESIKISESPPTIDRSERLVGRTYGEALGRAPGSQDDARAEKVAPPPKPDPDAKYRELAAKVTASKHDVLIEVNGTSKQETESRGNHVRDVLVDAGVPAKRVHVTSNVAATNAPGLRVLAVDPSAVKESTASATHAPVPEGDNPVGESHFVAEQPMTVKAGTSAMVAMVHRETKGGVVYLYDPISDRGDKKYAFKAIHLINPTHDTLEPGPVTVYGDGRFVGEGITEPVPPDAAVVVPFALDREIVVNPVSTETDRIAKLVTVQRGQLTAEVQHRRNTRYTITSRLADRATVYVRHRLEPGWQLVTAPSAFLRVGDSQLFQITLGPGDTKYIDIAEAAPVERSFELSSEQALDMMKVYIDEPDATPALKQQIETLLATHRGAADLVDKIATLRDQLVELQNRESELHAQLQTLRTVKGGSELAAALRQKLADTSDRIQKATLAIVDTQDKLMLQRVKFANQLSDLHLTDATVSKR